VIARRVELTMPCRGEMLRSAAAAAVAHCGALDAGMEVLRRLEARLGVLSSEQGSLSGVERADPLRRLQPADHAAELELQRPEARLGAGRAAACTAATDWIPICCGGSDKAVSHAHPRMPDGLQTALHGDEGRRAAMALAERKQMFAPGRTHRC